MDEDIQRALACDRTIDITGTPGRRDWYANLLAHPECTFHLKQTVQADLPAHATPILEPAQRREVLARIHQNLGGGRDLEAWVAGSPLVQVVLLGDDRGGV